MPLPPGWFFWKIHHCPVPFQLSTGSTCFGAQGAFCCCSILLFFIWFKKVLCAHSCSPGIFAFVVLNSPCKIISTWQIAYFHTFTKIFYVSGVTVKFGLLRQRKPKNIFDLMPIFAGHILVTLLSKNVFINSLFYFFISNYSRVFVLKVIEFHYAKLLFLHVNLLLICEKYASTRVNLLHHK